VEAVYHFGQEGYRYPMTLFYLTKCNKFSENPYPQGKVFLWDFHEKATYNHIREITCKRSTDILVGNMGVSE
jgi:hypothetical protein